MFFSANPFAICVSFIIALSALNLHHEVNIPGPIHINIPPNKNGISRNISLSKIYCPLLELSATTFTFDSKIVNYSLDSNASLNCSLSLNITTRVEDGGGGGGGEKTPPVITNFFSTGNISLLLHKNEELAISTQTNPETCFITHAELETCTFQPELLELSLDIDGKLEPEAVDKIAEWVWNEFGGKVLCKYIAPLLVKDIAKVDPLPPLNKAPALLPGGTDVRDMKLFQAVAKILSSVPSPIDGVFGANATLISDTTARIFLFVVVDQQQQQQNKNSSDNTGVHFSLPELGIMNLTLPSSTTFLVDIAFTKASHVNTADVNDYLLGGFSLVNFRSYGDGTLGRFVDDALSQLLLTVIDELLPHIVSHNDTVTLPFPADGAFHNSSPGIVILASSISFLTISCFLLIFYVYKTYACEDSPYLLLDREGKEIPPIETMRRNIIILVAAGVICECFIVFGTTVYAESVAADTLVFYKYVLINSIADFWKADLQFLAVVVALFSGVYPYVKIALLVWKGVICQRPQSRALLTLDSVGKVSLLDSFLFQVLVAGLQIKGFCSVRILTPFYLYLFGTVASMVLGNYATHGYCVVVNSYSSLNEQQEQEQQEENEKSKLLGDNNNNNNSNSESTTARITSEHHQQGNLTVSQQRYDVIDDEIETPTPFVNSSSNNNNGNSDSGNRGFFLKYNRKRSSSENILVAALKAEEKHNRKNNDEQEEEEEEEEDSPTTKKIISIVCTLLILASFLCTIFVDTVNYKMFGISVLFVGPEQTYTLWQVFANSSFWLALVAFSLVYVAPLLLSTIGYYYQIPELCSYSCSDVFSLALIAGLLGMRVFVATVVGEFLSKLLRVKAELNFPAYVLMCVSVVTWFLIAKIIKAKK